MRTRLLRFLSVLSLFVASGCASAPSDGPTGAKLRVTLRDHVGGAIFELVSESYDDRVEYYSQVRHAAARKFQGDQVMDALIDELDDLGFERYAKGGRAPSDGRGVVTRSVEIQRGTSVECWVVGQGTGADEKLAFHDCTGAFLQLYNVTQAYQAIDNDDGERVFKEGRT